MKYKNIHSAIHNFGDSFISSMNYVDEGHVIDDIRAIRSEGHDITIDWLAANFEPGSYATARIKKSLDYYVDGLDAHLTAQNVELARLISLKFCWPIGGRKFMEATDDRGKHYKIYVREFK